MRKTKRWVAVAMAASMVMGSAVTAFAADGDDAVATSGSTQGTGTNEGHVDTHVINVILPTIPEGSTPFAYTMDTERLIQDTNGAKYSGASFPDADDDTGVYFLTGTDENNNAVYENTSEALKVISKSSADVKLKVEVSVTSADTDIKLVDTVPASTVTDPELYLALQVGDEEAKAIKKGETASVEVTIQGKDDNFEKKYENGEYVYAEKQDAASWNETTISLTGAVSKASAEGLTAPVLTVTWKYTDPAETQTTQPALSKTSVSASDNIITVSNGTVSSIVLIKAGATTETALSDPKHYSLVENEISFSTSVLTNNVGGKIKVSFTEGGSAELAIE